MKVGLSLSFCIGDMIRGLVDPAEVRKIVAATKASTPEGWDKVIADYRETYWYADPARGEALVRQFLAEGKIEQPRLEGRGYANIAWAHWLDETPAGLVMWSPRSGVIERNLEFEPGG